MNHTEHAPVLSRRLIEIFAIVSWITDVPSESEIRALRVELKGVEEHRKTGEAMLPLYASIGHYDIAAIKAIRDRIVEELKRRGMTEPVARPSYIDMLCKNRRQLVARYRLSQG